MSTLVRNTLAKRLGLEEDSLLPIKDVHCEFEDSTTILSDPKVIVARRVRKWIKKALSEGIWAQANIAFNSFDVGF